MNKLRSLIPLVPMIAPAELLLIIMCGFAAGGCRRAEDEPIRECDAYASTYDRCLARLSSGAASTVEPRSQKLRVALESQIRGANDAKRDELRASCVAGLQQLEKSCR